MLASIVKDVPENKLNEANKPLSEMYLIGYYLQRKDLYDMTVTVLHKDSDMGDIIRYTRDADVVIVAIGNPRFVE